MDACRRRYHLGHRGVYGYNRSRVLMEASILRGSEDRGQALHLTLPEEIDFW